MVATLGGALSLMTESILFGIMGSHGDALSLMVIGSLAAPLMVLWIFPEPSGRVLEEISLEKIAVRGRHRGRRSPLSLPSRLSMC